MAWARAPARASVFAVTLLVVAIAAVAAAGANGESDAADPVCTPLSVVQRDEPHSVAPPVLSSSVARQSSRSIPFGRTERFDRTSSLADRALFSLVDIPATGGDAFAAWARAADNVRSTGSDSDGPATFPAFFPTAAAAAQSERAGAESVIGNLYDLEARPNATRLLMLRSPRAHVMALLADCTAFHGKDEVERAASGEPSAAEALIDYAVLASDTGATPLECYNPWNFQARHLQSSARHPHAQNRSCDFEPSFDGAVAEVLRMDWVGLHEFYHESRCLLAYRIGGAAHPYVESCVCPGGGGAAKEGQAEGQPDGAGQQRRHLANTRTTTTKKKKHKKKKKPESNMVLTPKLTVKVDRLTVVDRFVYGVALRGFIGEMVELEKNLGRRVMCAASLRSSRESLLYIADVAVLYDLVKTGGFHT